MLDLVLALVVATASCDLTDKKMGICGSLDDTGVLLDGSRATPGGTLDLDGGTGGGASDPPCDNVRMGECQFWISPPPSSAGVTMADVAHFAPSVGGHVMEPSGWAVIGLPANFFATTSPQVLAGTVLGTSAEVRFTPVAWHWDYGDGSARDSSTAGASWAALGAREFASTATSHVFAERGDYVVTLTVDFTAEYRVGAGEWSSIPGILPRAAPPLRVLSRDARTVLVDEDCVANPRGPGC